MLHEGSQPRPPRRSPSIGHASTLGRVEALGASVAASEARRRTVEERLLHEAASVLLPGGPERIDLPDTGTASRLLALAQAEAVLGPLLVALPDSATDLRERALAQHERTMLWCLELELRLLEIKDWFDEAGGVEFRVLKGPAVAHLDEPDPSLRTFADLDLLIHERDMDRAIVTLTAHGVERRIPQRRPGFDRRFVKGVGMASPDGIEIDLHRTLCIGALGFRIPLDDLFDGHDHFIISGQTFAAMRVEHRALHAAYHATLGTTHPPLKTLRDLAGYLTHPALTPDALVPIARRWGGETVLGEAVRAVFDTLSFEAPAWREWLAGSTPDAGQLDLIARTRRSARWPVELPTLKELNWRDRAAFLWAVAVPSREVLADEGQSRWQRLRSQGRKLLRGR